MSSEPTARRTVLVVQHADYCPPALLGDWLAEHDLDLDVRRPYAGDPLPGAETVDGLLVLGGPMGATDDEEAPWLPATRDLLRRAVAADVPTLGLCLGHQLVAAALGGEVAPNPRGKQAGLLDVGWLPEAADDALWADLATPRRVLHHNNDIVTRLPDEAVLLARAPAGEIQAARYAARCWGLQAHPEVDESVVGEWVADEQARGEYAGPPDLLDRVAEARGELDAAWEPLATAYAAVVHGARASR